MEIISEPVTMEPEEREPEAVPVTVTVEPEPAVRSRGRPKGAPNKPRAQVQVIPEPVVPVAPVTQPRPKRAPRAVAAMTRAAREIPAPAPEPAPPASIGDMLSMLAQALVEQKSSRSQQRRAMYEQFLT